MARSHGQRSSSVSGVPACIFATFDGGWKASPSSRRQPSCSATPRAIVVLPLPETPIITAMVMSLVPPTAAEDNSAAGQSLFRVQLLAQHVLEHELPLLQRQHGRIAEQARAQRAAILEAHGARRIDGGSSNDLNQGHAEGKEL